MTGIERANGHKPTELMHLTHPALRAAPRPDRAKLAFDLDRALDAVVRLHADVPEDAFTAANLGTEREGAAVLIGEDGLGVTIGYLITEAERVTLKTADGVTAEAVAIGYDQETGFGLVRAETPLGVAPLPFGDSAALRVGQEVVVSGHGGYAQAIGGRVIGLHEFSGSWEYLLDEAIFTTPMHPFWGGAALLDAAGGLVGVGSLYIEEQAASGRRVPGNMFVPIDLLKPILDPMVRTGRSGRPPHPWLGIYVAEAGDKLIVTGVAPAGPAERYGLEPGDVVLNVEGNPVTGLAEMYRTIWKAGAPGVEIRFTLLREDDVVTVRVKSADRYARFARPRRN